jgi:Sigma-70 region 2
MVDFLQTRPSLLLRLRDPRDGEAWTQFVDLYAPLVYGHARKYGLQNADAADLSQEVLSAVAGAVGRLEYDPQHGTFQLAKKPEEPPRGKCRRRGHNRMPGSERR